MARVVIGLSGGVDSSVAAWLLKEQGHEVVGLFMINWHDTTGTLEGDCPWHDDRVFAELVARKLDIELHVVDLSADYRTRVVDYMFAEYERGRTPNPDVLCNREIKFDVFLREALKLGADYVATGHYCRKAEETLPDGRTIHKLLAGSDPNKDQSYFLSLVPHARLEKAVFPLGNWRKEAVRGELARRSIVPPLPSESQEICFVPDDDYRAFLKNRRVRLPGPGPIVTTRGRKIGSHAGLWQYTEGQRKGLGIAWHEPLYVVGKDMENNMLLVGGREALASPGCVAEEVNLLVPYEDWPAEVAVRIRYRQQPLSARVTLRDGRLYARFREPQPPAARGQVLAVYDMEHHVLGGGVILGPLP